MTVLCTFDQQYA